MTSSEKFEMKIAKLKAKAFAKAEAKRLNITITQYKMYAQTPDPELKARLLARKRYTFRKKAKYACRPTFVVGRMSAKVVAFLLELMAEKRYVTSSMVTLTELGKVQHQFRSYRAKLGKGMPIFSKGLMMEAKRKKRTVYVPPPL